MHICIVIVYINGELAKVKLAGYMESLDWYANNWGKCEGALLLQIVAFTGHNIIIVSMKVATLLHVLIATYALPVTMVTLSPFFDKGGLKIASDNNNNIIIIIV